MFFLLCRIIFLLSGLKKMIYVMHFKPEWNHFRTENGTFAYTLFYFYLIYEKLLQKPILHNFEESFRHHLSSSD